jgi:hypothetical protein
MEWSYFMLLQHAQPFTQSHVRDPDCARWQLQDGHAQWFGPFTLQHMQKLLAVTMWLLIWLFIACASTKSVQMVALKIIRIVKIAIYLAFVFILPPLTNR